MQVLQAGATISALLSAAVAAAITLDASQDTAAFQLLHVRTSGVSKSVFVLLQFVCRSPAGCIQGIVPLYAPTLLGMTCMLP